MKISYTILAGLMGIFLGIGGFVFYSNQAQLSADVTRSNLNIAGDIYMVSRGGYIGVLSNMTTSGAVAISMIVIIDNDHNDISNIQIDSNYTKDIKKISANMLQVRLDIKDIQAQQEIISIKGIGAMSDINISDAKLEYITQNPDSLSITKIY